MQEALFYEKQENQNVTCNLCPWYCKLKPGQTGVCNVRENIEGQLVTDVYDKWLPWELTRSRKSRFIILHFTRRAV